MCLLMNLDNSGRLGDWDILLDWSWFGVTIQGWRCLKYHMLLSYGTGLLSSYSYMSALTPVMFLSSVQYFIFCFSLTISVFLSELIHYLHQCVHPNSQQLLTNHWSASLGKHLSAIIWYCLFDTVFWGIFLSILWSITFGKYYRAFVSAFWLSCVSFICLCISSIITLPIPWGEIFITVLIFSLDCITICFLWILTWGDTIKTLSVVLFSIPPFLIKGWRTPEGYPTCSIPYISHIRFYIQKYHTKFDK